MHEASIAKDALEILRETLNLDPCLRGKKVKEIVFTQGWPHTVCPESFELFFSEMVKNTPLENAKVTFIESEGTELLLKSIEVEDENHSP
jgi:Zn finger protein HypA/HybF involved in hydrogenase expression